MSSYDGDDLPRGRVLVVEDEPMIRMLLELGLQEAGLDVCSAENGAEALSILEQASFDIVLLDYLMPGMTGLEVSAQVRRSNPNLPIALISGSAALLTNDEIMAAGVTRIFPKPFDLNHVIAWIDSVLPRHP
jgi:CheY-like chemotaxis protein